MKLFSRPALTLTPFQLKHHQLQLSSTQNAQMSMAGGKLSIVILYGSTRNGRNCEKVGTLVQNLMKTQVPSLSPVVFDPLKMPFEMLKTPLHFYQDPSQVPGWLSEADKKLQNADGFVLLSTEYNCLPPPALTNMMSHFPRTSYVHRPAALITYSIGPFGGMRASVMAKAFAHDFGILLIPTFVPIPGVESAFPGPSFECKSDLVRDNVSKALKELEWYAQGLKSMRKSNPLN